MLLLHFLLQIVEMNVHDVYVDINFVFILLQSTLHGREGYRDL